MHPVSQMIVVSAEQMTFLQEDGRPLPLAATPSESNDNNHTFMMSVLKVWLKDEFSVHFQRAYTAKMSPMPCVFSE